jgi:hexulose-6-phosphate isomerase
MTKRHIGIMQGRLVPPYEGRIQAFPRDNWRDEFGRAKDAGIDGIEWIFDAYGDDVNPIVTESGIEEMRALSQQTGVQVRSVCADYFMDYPLIRCSDGERDERLGRLHDLLERGARLGIRYVILPFVDAAKIDSEAEMREFVRLAKERILPAAAKTGTEIHLETSLPPASVRWVLSRIRESHFRINYDSGNSSSLGYKPDEEFLAYGDRIGSVHIKDRVLGASTVPLGSGSADFDRVFANLAETAYDGSFILQVARGQDGEEVEWARRNRAWLEQRLQHI